MTFDEIMTSTIAMMLRPLVRRAVYPETTYNHESQWDPKAGFGAVPNADISDKRLERAGYKEKYGKKPLAPRERLAARLGILLALSHARSAIMKEILADTESIADAKEHGYKLNLGDEDNAPA